MTFNVQLDGNDDKASRWRVCQGRETVTLKVSWMPPPLAPEEIRGQPPACRLTYLATPGATVGAAPSSLQLAREASDGAWAGQCEIQALAFSPLRVRVELQPAFGHAHVAHVHIVPLASAWTATGLVIVSLVAIAALLVLTLATLRLTMTQAATGLSSVALLSAALVVLRRAIATLLPAHLPWLGVTYLIHRALIACALGFAGVIIALQSCVVAIQNDTQDEITMVLPWRDKEEKVAPHGHVSVVPPDGRAFRSNLLSAVVDKERPLCVDDGRESRDPTACRRDAPPPAPTLGARFLGLFTPPTLVLRCGRRWLGLDPVAVIDRTDDIVVDSNTLWLEPKSGSTCAIDPVARLWYEVEGVAHRVRFPWEPADLGLVGKLSLDPGDDHEGAGVTLVSLSKSDGDLQETRISLGATISIAQDGWPIAGLADASSQELNLQIGDLLRRPSESFAYVSELRCGRTQARGTTFHATRLTLEGTTGWLKHLDAGSEQGLGWISTWTLTRSIGSPAAVPWICEAVPGERPQLAKRVAFSVNALTLRVDDRDLAPGAPFALIAPASLMARTIHVHRAEPANAEIGVVQCQLRADDREPVAIVRVRLDDKRGDHTRTFEIAPADVVEPVARWEARTTPDDLDRRDGGLEAWFCWRSAERSEHEVSVTITPIEKGHTTTPIHGTWYVQLGKIELAPPGKVQCYYNEERGVSRKRPANARLLGAARTREFVQTLPEARGCDVVHRYQITPEGGP